MPAKSEKQLKLIFTIRNKYKSKLSTPQKWHWVWDEEWTHLKKESYVITNFKDFYNKKIEKFKKIISNKESEFRIFIKKYKSHLQETAEAREILIKYVSGKEVTKKEIAFMKEQSVQVIKSLGIGIPTILLPGGLALLAFLIWLSKRFKINILPDYLKSDS